MTVTWTADAATFRAVYTATKGTVFAIGEHTVDKLEAEEHARPAGEWTLKITFNWMEALGTHNQCLRTATALEVKGMARNMEDAMAEADGARDRAIVAWTKTVAHGALTLVPDDEAGRLMLAPEARKQPEPRAVSGLLQRLLGWVS